MDRGVLTVVFIAFIFIFAIGYTVFSATTISTNITTDGSLTVSGVLTVGGAATASSTFQATGAGLFYDTLSAGASTNSPTTTFNVTGSGYFTGGLGVGFATTGAGQIHASGLGVFGGRLGANGTTSPYMGFGNSGSIAASSGATTTLSAESTGSTVGGCIELKSSGTAVDTRWIRIYVGSTGATTTATGAVVQANGRGLLIVEEGRCQ